MKKTNGIKWLELMTASLALVTAIISFWITCNNKKDIESIKLQSVSDQIAHYVTIVYPGEKSKIASPVFEMGGAITRKLPQGYRLWVFAKSNSNYFIIYPPAEVVTSMNKWRQTNIQLSTKGIWSLHLCVSSETGTEKVKQYITECRKKGVWPGMAELPQGVACVKYITVNKI